MRKILNTLIALFMLNIAQANTLQEMQNELDTAQYARAATTGLALLRQQPDNLKLQFLTAYAFQKNNQQKQAIRYYQEIIESHPELPEPRNNLAIIYLQQGAYDEAVKLLIASLNTHPAYATAYDNLNRIYQGLASEAYRKALSDDLQPANIVNKIELTELNTLQLPGTLASVPAQQTAQIIAPETTTIAAQPIVVAAVPPVVEKPAAKPAVLPTADKEQLIQRVKNWGSAWSEQQFDQYVLAYTDTFSGQYPDHETWLQQRRQRVVSVDHIKLTLSNFKVKIIDANTALVDFHQSYQSSTYSDRVIKRVQLERINNDWKISRETTLAVL